MKITRSYIRGFKISVSSIGMTILIYLLILLLGLLVAIPFKNMLGNAAANSMSINSLLSEFDYTVYKDFILQNKSIPKIFQLQVFWFGIFFLLASVFLSGGILFVIHNENNIFNIKNFLTGCGEYFFRFFKLALIAILLHGVIAIVIYGFVGFTISDQIDSFSSESEIFAIIGLGVFAHILFGILLMIIIDYSKIIMYGTEKFTKSFAFIWSINIIYI